MERTMKRGGANSLPPADVKRPFRGTQRFELVSRLGEGGYGAVYEAHDRVRDQRVALKVLTRIGPDHLLRFKQEFRALQDLQHPNLVQLGEMFEDEGRWFFTMELVKGVDWLEYVRGKSAPASKVPDQSEPVLSFDVVRLRASLSQLVEGVLALHVAGKVHRDIKPSNIHVTHEGRVVLLDFGLVTSVEGRQTMETAAVGTAAYMAPEQATGVPVGAAADWYGVGVVLYEALTGRLPFMGSAFEMLLSKQSTEPSPPRVLNAEIPLDLSALCVGLLKPDPISRLSGEEVLHHTRGGTSTDTDPGPRYATVATRGVPFVGREGERGILGEAFARSVGEGRMGAVYVHGESGVGKTALVHEFTEQLETESSRVVVLRGRCYERETVPYKAFDGVVDALTRFLRTLTDAQCTALLPRRAPALPMVFPVLGRVKAVTAMGGFRAGDVDRATLRAQALAALRELFERMGEQYTLVIVIDDLQWADAESLALLTELSRSPDAPALMLVVTARDPEECPPEVQSALSTLAEQAPVSSRIRLEGLPLADAQRLAEALLSAGDNTHSIDAEQIAREAEGHPLFIDALVRYSQQVRLTAGARPELDDALRFRIGQLEPDSRRLLELCALAAAPLPHKVAADAAGWPFSVASTNIAKLRVLKLVRTSRTRQAETVETFHDRIRHATVTRLTQVERRKQHRRLAEAIETNDPIDVEAAAFHWREAQAFDRAALFAGRAADRAMENLAFDKAARLYREVIELETEPHWQVRVKLADALSNAGRGREAADVYMATIDVAPPAHKDVLRRRATQELLGSGNIDAGMRVARELLSIIDVAIPESTQKTMMSLWWNRTKLGVRGLGYKKRETTDLTEQELSRVDALWALSALTMVDPFRAADLTTRHLMWALATGDPYRMSRALSVEAWYRASSGHGDDRRSERAIAAATELAQECAHPHALALAQLAVGVTAYHGGRLREARARCETAESMLRERCTAVAWEITNARMFALWATMHMGDFVSLRRLGSASVRESMDRGDRYAYTNLTASVGYALAMFDGDFEDALASVDEAVQAWSQQGFYVQHFYALVAYASLALATGDVEQAAQIIDTRWPELERSELLRAQSIALPACWVRARTYAALAARRPAERARLVTAAADARRIAGMRSNKLAPAIAASLRAAIMRAKGDSGEAVRLLEQARVAMVEHELYLPALGCAFAVSKLVGGSEGQRLEHKALQHAGEYGIPSLELAARVYWPT
jgi:tetratricopeptide (TPR) repeat protein